MGHYRIVIEGTGAHHNPGMYEGDADALARKLVLDLIDKGHSIHAQHTRFSQLGAPGAQDALKSEPLILVSYHCGRPLED